MDQILHKYVDKEFEVDVIFLIDLKYNLTFIIFQIIFCSHRIFIDIFQFKKIFFCNVANNLWNLYLFHL